ncbi:MAG: hypothetical protein ACYDHO_01705 [Gaiellaceae bacterium]
MKSARNEGRREPSASSPWRTIISRPLSVPAVEIAVLAAIVAVVLVLKYWLAETLGLKTHEWVLGLVALVFFGLLGWIRVVSQQSPYASISLLWRRDRTLTQEEIEPGERGRRAGFTVALLFYFIVLIVLAADLAHLLVRNGSGYKAALIGAAAATAITISYGSATRHVDQVTRGRRLFTVALLSAPLLLVGLGMGENVLPQRLQIAAAAFATSMLVLLVPVEALRYRRRRGSAVENESDSSYRRYRGPASETDAGWKPTYEERRAHLVKIFDVRCLPDDPKPYDPYFVAICACDWVGDVSDTAEKASLCARKHHSDNIAPGLVRPLA